MHCHIFSLEGTLEVIWVHPVLPQGHWGLSEEDLWSSGGLTKVPALATAAACHATRFPSPESRGVPSPTGRAPRLQI